MSDAVTISDPPVIKRSQWFWCRVAVSAFFGLLSSALCILWVRSYSWTDSIYSIGTDHQETLLRSETGGLLFMRYPVKSTRKPRLKFTSRRLSGGVGYVEPNLQWHSRGKLTYIKVPLLAFSLVFGSITLLVGSHLNSFSLRTLLLATTLVALLLGLVAWAAR